jgi:calnexin
MYQGAVGLELWSMSDNILFDNIIITDNKIVSEQWAAETFDVKRNLVDKDQVFIINAYVRLLKSIQFLITSWTFFLTRPIYNNIFKILVTF